MNGIIGFLLEISFNLLLPGNHVMQILLKTQDAGWAPLVESVCVIVIKGKVECEGREERLKNTEGVFFFLKLFWGPM